MVRRKYIVILLGLLSIVGLMLFFMLDKSDKTDTTSVHTSLSYLPYWINDTSSKVVPIRVAVSMDEDEFQYWEQANAEVSKAYPYLQVELTNFKEEEAYSAWVKSSQLGEPFDIILMDNHWIREFAVQGFLLPTDEMYVSDSLGDHLKALTEPLRWNGSIWGVPVDFDPIIIAWNEQLLNKVGQKIPVKWEEFNSIYTKMKKANPLLKAVNMKTSEAEEVIGWMGAFDESHEEAANLDPLNAVMKQQVQFAIQQSSELDPDHQIYELLKELERGNLLSAVMSWSQYKRLAVENFDVLNVAPEISSIAWEGGRSFVITAKSSQHQQLRQWMTLMTSPSRQLERYDALGKLPTRNSTYSKENRSSTMSGNLPLWVVEPLMQSVYITDPYWSERWIRWQQLWSTDMQRHTKRDRVDYVITAWNDQQ